MQRSGGESGQATDHQQWQGEKAEEETAHLHTLQKGFQFDIAAEDAYSGTHRRKTFPLHHVHEEIRHAR